VDYFLLRRSQLGHALALVKAQQDLKYTPKVMTNSEKTGYKKRGRKVYGSPESSTPTQAALEMTV
jgi:hypothetical protein